MISFPPRHIHFQVQLLLMLKSLDTNSNISLCIVLARTSNSFLSSGLGMGMSIIYGKIGKILTKRPSRYIGTRSTGLAGSRLGVLGVGTALVYEFLHLDLWFHNWFEFCVGILEFLHFMFWASTQVFFVFGNKSCASTHVL